MVVKNGVKNIQAASYNGARTLGMYFWKAFIEKRTNTTP